MSRRERFRHFLSVEEAEEYAEEIEGITVAVAADLERDGDAEAGGRLVARPDRVAFAARLHPRSLVSCPAR